MKQLQSMSRAFVIFFSIMYRKWNWDTKTQLSLILLTMVLARILTETFKKKRPGSIGWADITLVTGILPKAPDKTTNCKWLQFTILYCCNWLKWLIYFGWTCSDENDPVRPHEATQQNVLLNKAILSLCMEQRNQNKVHTIIWDTHLGRCSRDIVFL